ncbi:PREDICTED: ribose-phosphate pyrophosphokinase 4-like [Priapulus caudatus]|uniref:Ribose-phosphate pyrophosphokinase 4-like n=1 Tax=Priapulus caudatus TaxID=37621 RepID=A0ABM1ECZ9_PRICU|nr:PREDICTED: ribose-phosphate pyrophosphokinase 4-like [Priapulus caudatus]
MTPSGREEVWLMSHSSMDNMAERIVQLCELSKEKNPPSKRRCALFKKNIQWDHFKDGFPNIFIDDVKDMAGKDVIFLASFHTPAVIFEQLSVLYAIPRYLARSFHIILPYFATGTMEKIDKEGQVVTAKTLATLLSAVPLTARGPAQILMFDIHALQERFYFGDNVIPRLVSAIPLIKRELENLEQESWCVVFPDDGAFKRFGSFFPDNTVVTCSRLSEGAHKIIRIRGGKPAGKHAVIIDDLVHTGNTLVECAKTLLCSGAVAVSAYATHAMFTLESWRRFVEGDVQFANFWITDSVPQAQEISQHPPFKLLSLVEVIAEVMLGYDLMQY